MRSSLGNSGYDESVRPGQYGSLTAYGNMNNSSSSLKGKLLGLEDNVKGLNEDIGNNKRDVQLLRSEKDSLESALNAKVMELRKYLMNELSRIEDEMKRHFVHQKQENNRMQQQITSLKGEKTAMQQLLLKLQRRLSDLESQIGNESG